MTYDDFRLNNLATLIHPCYYDNIDQFQQQSSKFISGTSRFSESSSSLRACHNLWTFRYWLKKKQLTHDIMRVEMNTPKHMCFIVTKHGFFLQISYLKKSISATRTNL